MLCCAAAGDTAAGNPRIYRAGALVAPNLQRMVELAQQLEQQGDSSGQLQVWIWAPAWVTLVVGVFMLASEAHPICRMPAWTV